MESKEEGLSGMVRAKRDWSGMVSWHGIDYYIKQLDERSRTCRECDCMYSEVPSDRGKYQGDNEPILSNFLVSE